MNEVSTPNEGIAAMQACSISDVCRLCAGIDDIMIPIFADEGAAHMLEAKIKTHLPFINISENDLLPKRVCYHCASAILVWNEVYETSSDADQKLRSMCENSFDQTVHCKDIPYDEDTSIDISEIHDPVKTFIHFEEMSDVHMFSKDVKSDKTLNELDKDSSSSKDDTILNHESKSPVIQQDEKLSPVLKSESPDIFDEEEEELDEDDEEDHNMYLGAAGIDDDMNGLMNGHRLEDVPAVDEDCGNLIPKTEFEDSEEEDQKSNIEKLDEMEENNDQAIPECKVSEPDTSPIIGTDVSVALPKTEVKQCRRSARNKKKQEEKMAAKNVVVKTEITDSDDKKSDGDGGSGVCVGRIIAIKKCVDEDDDDDADDEDEEIQPMSIRRLLVNEQDKDTLANERSDDDDEKMCQICATVFKTRYNLLRHFQKRHPEYKMYECDLCRICFPSINEFKNHLEEKHSKVHTTNTADSKQVRFACDVCGNMYKNKASAMNHLLTHTSKKTVHCTFCDFTCYTKQQLGVHQTKHDKRFVCDICNKRFAQKSQLDVHINAVHYNQRPYSCVLCNKSFKTKGSHDAHMIVHTDTRNYQCPHCDKKCRKRYDLTLHIRTHTGEKPFKCSVCGRGFVQMCDTRKHEMLHFRPGKRKSVFPADSASEDADDE